MRISSRQKGFTIAEMIIAATIATLLIVVVMNLFSSGLKGSQKGMAHLANMEAAFVVVSQFESDVEKAVDCIWDSNSVRFLFKKIGDTARCPAANYDFSDKTITRTYDNGNEIFSYSFCKGLDTEVRCRQIELNEDSPYKWALILELKVKSKFAVDGKKESFKIKRLVKFKEKKIKLQGTLF